MKVSSWTAISETIELSLTRLMNWLAKGEGRGPDRLGKDDVAHPVEARQAEARRGLPLAPRDRLDAASDDLGDIGALEHGEADDGGDEGVDPPPVAEQQLEPPALAYRQVAGIVADADERHDLRADEEVEDEDEDQRRDVAHHLDIAPPHQPEEETAGDPAEADQQADQRRADTGIEGEPERGEEAFGQEVRHEPARLGVGPHEQARHDAPVPVVDERRVGEPDDPANQPGQDHQHHDVDQPEAQRPLVTRPHGASRLWRTTVGKPAGGRPSGRPPHPVYCGS
ncbi:MAG: hypothetical protein R3D28_25810 [Geminicoccaceae bacterium]